MLGRWGGSHYGSRGRAVAGVAANLIIGGQQSNQNRGCAGFIVPFGTEWWLCIGDANAVVDLHDVVVLALDVEEPLLGNLLDLGVTNIGKRHEIQTKQNRA